MNGDSVGNTVRKMMTDAKVVAALSDPFAPATPEDMQRLARAHDKLWHAYEMALQHIEYLEIQLMHWADTRWRN